MDQRFGLNAHVTLPGPLVLDSGAMLAPIEIAYETYGTLDADASNAILICHAPTGDQHVASPHPRTGPPGRGARMVAHGLPLHPARHLPLCAHALGTSMGPSGP